MSTDESCFEVNASNFEKKVLRETASPVIVDLYASLGTVFTLLNVRWCGPCKVITPILENIVKASNGKARILSKPNEQLKLAKVDIEKNPNIAASLNV